MEITCPHCQTKLKGSEDHQGKKVRCPKCKQVFVVRPMRDSTRRPLCMGAGNDVALASKTRGGILSDIPADSVVGLFRRYRIRPSEEEPDWGWGIIGFFLALGSVLMLVVAIREGGIGVILVSGILTFVFVRFFLTRCNILNTKISALEVEGALIDSDKIRAGQWRVVLDEAYNTRHEFKYTKSARVEWLDASEENE